MHPSRQSIETPITVAPTAVDRAEVMQALELILASHPFHASKQCQNLLRSIVERSLAGDEGALRERVLGVEVFGRSPDYDTSEDPVVRMRAADVRKRLAQYYQSAMPRTLRIELLPGSYRASFLASSQQGEPGTSNTEPTGDTALSRAARIESEGLQLAGVHSVAPPLASKRWLLSKGWIAACGLLLVAAAGIGYRALQPYRLTAQQRFWAPVVSKTQPVLVYLGANAVYRFTPEFMAQYKRQHAIVGEGPEFFVDLAHEQTLQAKDLMPVPDTFVAVGDVTAAADVVSLMNMWRAPFALRAAADVSVGDLRNKPAVLIGGFNNRWTLEMTKDLRYSLRNGDRITDRQAPTHEWIMDTGATASAQDDYALIVRLQQAKTGGPLIALAGVGEFGTQAAGELLANPDRMREVLDKAPAGWQSKNMEIVLHVKVVDFTPSAPRVVATYYW